MATSPASGPGSEPFNGGTITDALTVGGAVGSVTLDTNGSIHEAVAGVTTGLFIGATDGDRPAIVIQGAVSEPVDFSVPTNSFAFWLDATPGATKLMVKAKDSSGTVRRAAVALT